VIGVSEIDHKPDPVNTSTIIHSKSKKIHGNKKMHKIFKQKRKWMSRIRQIINDNPNLNSQLIIILITLASGSIPMDRGIDDMTLMMEKIRNVTEIVNKTMQSVKVATEAPRQIRQLFEENYMK
jgi:hypothetical protein